jgi:acetyl esterase/lipase
MSFGIRVCLCLLAIALPASAQAPAKKERPRLIKTEIASKTFDFKKTEQGTLQLHAFYPPDWKESDKRPTIVFFFGGGWKNGAWTQFQPQAGYFASRGMVAISAEYRIESKHKTTPDVAVEDARSAVRWVRANAKTLGGDPDKLVASGGSAGAHLAACTALIDGFDAASDAKVSCKPNALVLFNPVLNLTNLKGRSIIGAGGMDVSKAISPTLFLDKKAPPAVIFFGTSDALFEHGKEYAAKAKELGVRAELYTAADQPHGFFNRTPWLEVTTRQADAFLKSLGYLKGEPTVTIPDGAKVLQKQ